MLYSLFHSLLTSAILPLILINIYSDYFTPKVKKVFIWIFMLVMECVMYLISLSGAPIAFFGMLYYPITVLIFYKDSFKHKLIYSFFITCAQTAFLIGLMLIETAILPQFIVDILNNGAQSFYDMLIDSAVILITYLLFYLIFKLFNSFFSKNKIAIKKNYKSYLYLLLPIVQLIGYLGALIIGYSETNTHIHQIALSKEFLIRIVFFTVVTVIMLLLDYLIFKTAKKNEKAKITEYKYDQLKRYLNSECDHYNQMAEVYKKDRKFMHDIKNKLITLNDLVVREDFSEVGKLIDGMYGDLSQFSSNKYCENELINVILTRKAEFAYSKGITINASIISSDINVSSSDLCSIISNLLDNAT